MSNPARHVVSIPFVLLDPSTGKSPADADVEVEVHALIRHVQKRARKRNLELETIIIALMEACCRHFAGPSLIAAVDTGTLGQVPAGVTEHAHEFAKIFESRLIQACAGDAPWATDS